MRFRLTWVLLIQLQDLSGLEGINSVGESFVLFSNPSIDNINSMSNLTSVGGNLEIQENPEILNLDGFSSLESVGAGLLIIGNSDLNSLAGLSSLVSIGGFLNISYNDNISTLQGLQNIEGESIQELDIVQNSSLSECSVESICEYLAAPNGFTYILYNAPGCNSIEEVEDE